MRVVEKEHGGIGAACRLGGPGDLRFDGLDAHHLHRGLDAVGSVGLGDEARLVEHRVLDGDAVGEGGEAREDHHHLAVEGAGEGWPRRSDSCHGAGGERLGQRLAVALRARRAPVESTGTLRL
jgi:hypothetical protein